MKKILIIVWCMMLGACINTLKTPTKIKGDFSKVDLEGVIYLTKKDVKNPKKVDLIDSTTINKGKFVFNLKNVEVGPLTLKLKGKKGTLDVFVLNGVTKINANTEKFSDSQVPGNVSDSLYKRNNTLNMSLVFVQLGLAYGNKIEKLSSDSAKQVLIELYKKTSEELKIFKEDLVSKYPGDPATVYILSRGDVKDYPLKDMMTLYQKLPVQIQETSYGKLFNEQIQKLSSLSIGVAAPDFSLPDTSGKMISVSSFRDKILMIDFWASWCGPCRRENPNVVEIYKDYHSKGFEVLSVSLDKTKEAWLKAISEDGLIWPSHVSDLQGWNNAAAKLYFVSAVPCTILIDREGKIVAKNLRGEELRAKVKELCQ